MPVRLWIERYGSEVLFAAFPGNKLYILLQRALEPDRAETFITVRKKLLPFHRPPRVVHAESKKTWLQQFKGIFSELSYRCFRLRFHIEKSFYYIIESSRWKKYIAEQQKIY